MKTFIFITAALSLSGLSATAASAQDVRISTSVSTQGLDLSRDNDVRVLKLRIHRAAKSLCGDYADSLYRGERKAHRACYNSAVKSTLAAVQARTNVSLAAR